MRVNFHNIMDLSEPLKVKCSEEIYKYINSGEIVIVGLLGLYNTGKTHFASRILKKLLPDIGFDKTTQGMQAAFPIYTKEKGP